MPLKLQQNGKKILIKGIDHHGQWPSDAGSRGGRYDIEDNAEDSFGDENYCALNTQHNDHFGEIALADCETGKLI